jgi:hypothetical protein
MDLLAVMLSVYNSTRPSAGPPSCHIAMLPTCLQAHGGGQTARWLYGCVLIYTHFLYTYFSFINRGVSSSRSAGVTSSQGTRRDACSGPAVGGWQHMGGFCNEHQHMLLNADVRTCLLQGAVTMPQTRSPTAWCIGDSCSPQQLQPAAMQALSQCGLLPEHDSNSAYPVFCY